MFSVKKSIIGLHFRGSLESGWEKSTGSVLEQRHAIEHNVLVVTRGTASVTFKGDRLIILVSFSGFDNKLP